MRGGSSGLQREQNALRVIDALRVEGPVSRADIARLTGLSRTTISAMINDLRDRGLVIERAENGRERAAQVGRPGILLELEPSAAAAVGLAFDHDRLRVAVSDLSRTILAEESVAFDVDTDALGAIALAGRLVSELLDRAGVDRELVLGAGVAVAGPVDHDAGVVHPSTVLMDWTEHDASVELTESLGMPVHLENDANLGALAEATFGAAAGSRVAAYISISSGIGAGIVVDRKIFRGHRGFAGEIGHVPMDIQGAICRCGNRGCLETVASVPALLQLINRPDVPTVAELIALAQAGDLGCRRALADVGRVIGRAIAYLVSLLGPETIVVGGEIAEAGELVLEPVREAVERFAMPTASRDVRIVRGALADRANLLGALALVITQSDNVFARIAGFGDR